MNSANSHEKKKNSQWISYSFSQMIQSNKIFAGLLRFFVVLLTLGSTFPAFAETFSIDGYALNTNGSIRKYDTRPEILMWLLNNNDPDQNFDQLSSNFPGAVMLKNRTTKACANSHYGVGSKTNTWTCNPADPDMAWILAKQQDGTVLLQNQRSKLCLQIVAGTTGRSNYGIATMQSCNVGNRDQKWQSSSAVVNPPPVTGGSYYRNFEGFVHFVVGQVGIGRLDTSAYKGQCVTLIARYLQEVYFTGADRTKSIALNNGFGTADAVASQFSQYFYPVTNQGLPIRGAVVSFPEIGYVPNSVQYGCPNNYCGHTAIVMESRTLSNGQRQMRIMDSNGDFKDENSKVTEYYSNWINIPNGSANGYGNNIRWTNPR